MTFQAVALSRVLETGNPGGSDVCSVPRRLSDSGCVGSGAVRGALGRGGGVLSSLDGHEAAGERQTVWSQHGHDASVSTVPRLLTELEGRIRP